MHRNFVMMDKIIRELTEKLKLKTPEEIIKHLFDEYTDGVTFSSSLGAEDQVLTRMIASINDEAHIFTLDTGRLFQETYDLLQRTQSRYGIKIKTIFPDASKVEKMVNEKGINLFYESVENRKQCCHIRKTEPLQRALKGKSVWISGLRREQSAVRRNIKLVEWDEDHKLIKVYPLANWSSKDVWDYINEHDIPYNTLHDKGFPSIGCLPCTKAVDPGEDPRSGRWWWEMDGHKECGLHKK